MGDIEGAICDNCGSVIGPYGCCATHRARQSELEQVTKERDELRQEMARWRCVLRGARAELETAIESEGDEESPVTERIEVAVNDLTRLIGDGQLEPGAGA